MANLVDQIDTIILLMFENRSFDHMLGHLSLENSQSKIDGLKEPFSQYKNVYNGDNFYPFSIPNDSNLAFDLPHEYDLVDIQLKKSINNKFTMQGFVEAYAKATGVPPNKEAEPLGFFPSAQVPITSFLARNFCTCNRWFTPLPTSTQPNRTMAFSGESSIFQTKLQTISSNNHLLKWMDDAGIKWRVYHDGLSFFALYPDLWPYLLSAQFRDYEFLYRDLVTEDKKVAPQVIIIEPTYLDAPHIGSDRPNDNHAPLAIGWGEEFLRRTYQAVTANESKWKKTVFIVYYDEHGGFYDHVPPPIIPYTTSSHPGYSFNSLGPRIPGIVVSPMVEKKSVSNLLFDHTSVLQLLAERFTPGKPYSDSVEQRKVQGINSLSQVITNEKPWKAPEVPSQGIEIKSLLGESIKTAPKSNMATAFEHAAINLLNKKPSETGDKYPELLLWRDATLKARKSL